ncbi:MAG: hypothetical protein F6K36_06600 [Symploca sp. SIO3C6]|uniref:Uncharacterized protein n=1 Tax=Symploca sp. SIO1C4 TaxID=2607765 RepID=A0A6B3N8C1_9CYAN|nr:hypothetical protein [Symploca sp. SIO3C6]NER26364.1 hypothetical protein [Symploca sp. SIO1C4]
MESIDELLTQISAEYKGKEQAQRPIPKPLPEQEQLHSTVPQTTTSQTHDRGRSFGSSVEDKLLVELQAEFEEIDRVEQLKTEQYQREKKRTEEQRIIKQREALIQPAKQWLKSLDVSSQEGLWFEEFAYNYPTKLEAAIDYLQALGKSSS